MDLNSPGKTTLKKRFQLIGFGVIIVLISEIINVFAFKIEPVIPHRFIFKIIFGAVLFSYLTPFFTRMLAKLNKHKTEAPKISNSETIENQGLVSLKLGKRKYIPGTVFITNKNLIYKSQKNNVQPSELRINHNNIDKVIKKKLALIGGDQGILIKQNDGKEFEFVVNNAESWIQEIEKRYIIG